MKVTHQELKKIIISELKVIAKKENWTINELKTIDECECENAIEDSKNIENNNNNNVNVISDFTTSEEFETVTPEENKEESENLFKNIEPQEVKKLAEELFRMKQLLGLKKPLLGEK